VGQSWKWELKLTINWAKAIRLVETLVRECKNAPNPRAPVPLYLQGTMVRFRVTENSSKTTCLSQDAHVSQSCNRNNDENAPIPCRP